MKTFLLWEAKGKRKACTLTVEGNIIRLSNFYKNIQTENYVEYAPTETVTEDEIDVFRAKLISNILDEGLLIEDPRFTIKKVY